MKKLTQWTARICNRGVAVQGLQLTAPFLPGAVVGFLIKGEEADIPARAEVTFRTKDVIEFAAAKPAMAVEAVRAETVAAPDAVQPVAEPVNN